jgi:hypothetical protein
MVGSEDDCFSLHLLRRQVVVATATAMREKKRSSVLSHLRNSQRHRPPSLPSESLRNAFGASHMILRPAIRSDERMGSSEAQTSPISSGTAALRYQTASELGRGAAPIQTKRWQK